MLGLYGGIPYLGALFGRGDGVIWLDDVMCSRDSQDLLEDCQHSSFGDHNCAHSEDAGVACDEISMSLTYFT